jgi:hypothetical protein
MPMGINMGCNSKEERDAYDNSRAICLHKSQNKIDGVQHFQPVRLAGGWC